MIYRVRWQETNWASAIVEADSAEEAIERVRGGEMFDHMETETYGKPHDGSITAETLTDDN